MAVKLNTKGKANASTLIKAGKVDKTSGWSFSTSDGDKLLGDPPDWKEYAKLHLGTEDSSSEDTKEHYKYVFGKNGKVYRSGLIAIKQRAAAEGATDIYNAAASLLEDIDGKKNAAKSYFTVKSQADNPDEAEVLLYGQIGDSMWSDGIGAKDFADQLKALGSVKKIKVHINSPGGAVFEGLAIHNMLKQHSADVTCYVDGEASSIASVIAMAGHVVMPENAFMMIHNPAGVAVGGSDIMRQYADILDKIKESIVTTYCDKSKMSAQDISDLMDAETWMTGKDALEMGFCNEICQPMKMAASSRGEFHNNFRHVPQEIKNIQNHDFSREDRNGHDPVKKEATNTMKCAKCGHDLVEGRCPVCEATATAATAERTRVSEIYALGQKYGILDKAKEFADQGKSIDDMRVHILDNNIQQPVAIAVIGDQSAEKPFKSMGEQLIAVANAAKQPHKIDKRLLHITNAAAGAADAFPSDGGFLIQQDFSIEMLRLTHETGILSSKCTSIPIGVGANGLRAPVVDETSRATGSRWGGVQVYRVNEADDLSGKGTKPKFALLDLRLEKMAGVFYATEDLLEDAAALQGIIMTAFPEEFGFMLDNEIVWGTGVGQCLGFMNSKAFVSVAKETSQTATTVVVQNVAKMVSRMYARGMATAEWFINQDVLPQLYTMTLGNYPIYMPPGGASTTPYGTLFGRPINVIEQASTVGTQADIILADFSQFVLIEKGGLDATTSMHVKFLTDEMTFKFIIRNNGQPIWKSAKTPYKGSNTVAPFVVLDTRS